MTRSHDDFTPELIDEQIDQFLQIPQLRQPAPSAALTQVLKVVCEEDAASLERVRERYAARLQAMPASSTQSFTDVLFVHPQRKELTMRDPQEKTEPRFLQPSVRPEKGWKRRLSAFAAILCTLVLVGSFFLIFNVARVNRTTVAGFQSAITPTPQAIPKAVLTNSPTGNGEGIGPGLSGIPATNHFTVGQKFWIFFIVNDTGGGTVTVKWYANNRLSSSSSQYIPAVPLAPSQGGIAPTPGPQRTPTPAPTPGPTASPVTSNFSTMYDQPGTGKVELYWQGRLAVTLFFVVKP